MKKLVIPLLLLGIIGAGIGYYMYNKPVASLEHKKPDTVVEASQLVSDYEADEKSANEKYLGKVVQVSGKVADITTEEGKKKVILETGNPMSMIICELENGNAPVSIKAGDEVKMKGMCSGYLSDVILVQASVVK
jgi:tRNA_anti-like